MSGKQTKDNGDQETTMADSKLYQIPRAVFAALQHIQAKRDLRYYLCGVLLDGPLAVATDGHVLGVVSWDSGLSLPKIIIPGEVVVAVAKLKDDLLTLEAMPDGRFVLADRMFDPVSGRFPDWRAVTASEENTEAGDCGFNPSIVGQVCKAVEAAAKAEKVRWPNVTFRPIGERSMPWATRAIGKVKLSGVVMPMRDMVAPVFHAFTEANPK